MHKNRKMPDTMRGMPPKVVDAGGQSSPELLFSLYSDAMLAYGMKFTLDRSLVKDCIQEVFVRLILNSDWLDTIDNVKSYLLVSLKHELVRQLDRRQRFFQPLEELPPFELEIGMESHIREGMDDDTLHQYRQLAQALNRLPPRQKEAIYLYYIQEIPLKDISALMDMEYQSVRNLLARGLKKLREHFAQDTHLLTMLLLTRLFSLH